MDPGQGGGETIHRKTRWGDSVKDTILKNRKREELPPYKQQGLL